MIKKCLISLIVITFYLFSFYLVSQDQPIGTFSKKHQDAKILPPLTLLKAVSGEFNSILSEIFFAYGSVLVGSIDQSSTKEDWKYSYQVIKLSRDLDPYFKDPYTMVQGIYPWKPKMINETISFLKKGITFRTWDTYIPYYIGFDYYFFLNNYKESADYLFMSAKKSHDPTMSSLAAKMASDGGDVETGLTFLTNMNTDSLTGPMRNTINMRIEALKGVQLLQKAIKQYEKIYNKRPDNLEALVAKGIIHKIPENPYKTTYKLEKNYIKFD